MIKRVYSENEFNGINLTELKNLKAIVGGTKEYPTDKGGAVPVGPGEDTILACRIIAPRM